MNFDIETVAQFNALALETFHFQAQHSEVYRSYLRLIGKDPKEITSVGEIPFLPIELFKSHTVYCGTGFPQRTFLSSATTGTTPSKHPVADLSIYEESLTRAFRLFFGAPNRYTFLALLPTYLERQDSSLVYMVNNLMQQSGAQENGFYLYNHEELYRQLVKLRDAGKRTLLFGVAFALLDFVEHYTLDFPDLEVVETGGMKGRGAEITRAELHQKIGERLGTQNISSEYSMAELLSQAYTQGGELFATPPWMAVLIRDFHDPFRLLPHGQKGGINVIDLANRYSCSFVETQDMGISYETDTGSKTSTRNACVPLVGNPFEILGRTPHSELRGCNLLLESAL